MRVSTLTPTRQELLDVMERQPQAADRLWPVVERLPEIRLLDIQDVFRDCPLLDGWPKFALVPSDATIVTVEAATGAFTFFPCAPEWATNFWQRKRKGSWSVSHRQAQARVQIGIVYGQATVPAVPAALLGGRPAGDFFTLFEVEAWNTRVIQVDPLLLSHVVGSLFEVVGEWNVTALERAVLQSL